MSPAEAPLPAVMEKAAFLSLLLSPFLLQDPTVLAVRENRGKRAGLWLCPSRAAALPGLCPDLLSSRPLIYGAWLPLCASAWGGGHSWRAHFFPPNVFSLFLPLIPVVSPRKGDEVTELWGREEEAPLAR